MDETGTKAPQLAEEEQEEQEKQQMCCDGVRTAEQHRGESADGKCCSDG